MNVEIAMWNRFAVAKKIGVQHHIYAWVDMQQLVKLMHSMPSVFCLVLHNIL